MAVNANTNETYDVSTIREDLQDALISISPTETPLMSSIGRRTVSNTYFEWPVVELAAASNSNRVAEGEAAPGNDAPTNALRLANYTQISDKVVEVSDTNEAVNGAGDAQRKAKQIAYKLKELKRDMETMLVGDNNAAVAGSSGTARETASLSAFLTTNVSRGSGGASGTLSGTTEGFPNAAATDGTLRALTETMLKDVIASCWNEGAEPTIVLCGSGVKQKISSTFTGSATRYRDISDKKVVASIDLYVSDFGELQIVPTRFIRSRDVFVLDPSYARVGYLQTTKQKPLARTGHSDRTLISVEYGLQVDTQKAHGVIADINPSL
ncbi:MAG TPA: DUF5309 family protein [Acidimicrobiia bacterium]